MEEVKGYSKEEKEQIKKAYYLAEELHKGTKRKSGEPYIIHPLNVAFTLARLKLDADTISAGLLHDTIEDTSMTKERLKEEFNEDVALLVDGVSKMKEVDFSCKQEQNWANLRKLMQCMAIDVRTIIIKLADRLHNMRTLEFMSKEKQIENAEETMEVFVSIANYLGMNHIQVELRDLAFMYLQPDSYKRAKEERDRITEESKSCLDEMSIIIADKLKKQGINSQVEQRIKSIYGISTYIEQNENLAKMNDLLALKIVVDNKADCYSSLGIIHQEFKPIQGKIKDYIGAPKTNLYQSLHTTVYGLDGRHIQAQIRTPEMHKIAANGLAAYQELYGQYANYLMQEELEKRMPFYSYLIEANESIRSNQDFFAFLKTELFTTHIHTIYDKTGEVIELPIGSSPIDFAYILDGQLGNDNINNLTGAIVNGENVSLSYMLQNQDQVQVVADRNFIGPQRDFLDLAKTNYAKRKIKESRTQQN